MSDWQPTYWQKEIDVGTNRDGTHLWLNLTVSRYRDGQFHWGVEALGLSSCQCCGQDRHFWRRTNERGGLVLQFEEAKAAAEAAWPCIAQALITCEKEGTCGPTDNQP